MDTVPIIIGSKSRFAPKARPRRQIRPAKQLVGIWTNNEYVTSVPKRALVRFSKTASRVLPRPTPTTSKQTTAEHSDKDPSVAAVTSQVQNLAVQDTKSAQDESFEVYFEGFPAEEYVVKACFRYMQLNNRRRHDEPLEPYLIEDETTLEELIDHYVGVSAFDIRPFPGHLRAAIMHHLTTIPVKADQIKYIYRRIQIRDGVMVRAITSTFDHWFDGNYTDEDYQAIINKANEYEDLKQSFNGVQRNREHKERRRADNRRDAAHRRGMKAAWGTKSDNGGQRQARSSPATTPVATIATSIPTAMTKTAAPETEAERGNGKGVGGRHVPGA